MKKISLIIGARPNFMKAFPVYEALKEDFELTLIHSGQHFDAKMSDVFFNQLKFPKPDIHLTLEKKTKSGDFDDKLYVNNADYLKDKDAVIEELMKYNGDLGQLGEIRDKLKVEFEKIQPDLVIVFGDVTSTLAAGLAAKMLNIELAHVESGLRSGDMLMPEEVNRVLTDHITKYYFVTEQSGVDNLKEIGITENVYLVGNTMIDTQKKYLQQALDTKYHETLGVKSKGYVLITLHRPSNVDNMDKLKEIFDDFEELSKTETLVYPIHPRTKNNLEKLGYLQKVQENPNIILDEPLGYLEFTCLMAQCKYVVTDSGGLQEESTSLDIPCFTLRENTERPSTLIENHGTNQMIHKISEIELKDCKGSMDLWDGKSSMRIKNILQKQHIFFDKRYLLNKEFYETNKTFLNKIFLLDNLTDEIYKNKWVEYVGNNLPFFSVMYLNNNDTSLYNKIINCLDKLILFDTFKNKHNDNILALHTLFGFILTLELLDIKSDKYVTQIKTQFYNIYNELSKKWDLSVLLHNHGITSMVVLYLTIIYLQKHNKSNCEMITIKNNLFNKIEHQIYVINQIKDGTLCEGLSYDIYSFRHLDYYLYFKKINKLGFNTMDETFLSNNFKYIYYSHANDFKNAVSSGDSHELTSYPITSHLLFLYDNLKNDNILSFYKMYKNVVFNNNKYKEHSYWLTSNLFFDLIYKGYTNTVITNNTKFKYTDFTSSYTFDSMGLYFYKNKNIYFTLKYGSIPNSILLNKEYSKNFKINIGHIFNDYFNYNLVINNKNIVNFPLYINNFLKDKSRIFNTYYFDDKKLPNMEQLYPSIYNTIPNYFNIKEEKNKDFIHIKTDNYIEAYNIKLDNKNMIKGDFYIIENGLLIQHIINFNCDRIHMPFNSFNKLYYSNKKLKYFIVGDYIAFIIPIIQDFSFNIQEIYMKSNLRTMYSLNLTFDIISNEDTKLTYLITTDDKFVKEPKLIDNLIHKICN